MEIDEYLQKLENELLDDDNFQEIGLTKDWSLTIPPVAGVYILKDRDKIVYVGETGNLRARMRDFLDSRQHSVRRTLGKNLFSEHHGFIQATTSLKFSHEVEVSLNNYIKGNYKLAFKEITLGRKELEERIEKLIDLEVKLNKRGKRKNTIKNI